MSMSVSLKKATNKTNIRHNNRTMSEKEKEQNSHIDYSRSDENKYLVQKDLKKLYREEFGEVLENYNAKQKRNDRKIDDYYKHIQFGKKTALQQEMIIQVGDLNNFISNADYEKANEILLEWFKDFEKRNPNLKVYNAVIHNDEASPHMHSNFVPVASGYKRGLEKQVSFDRAITQQDPTLDKTRPFDDWREKEVKILEEMLKERGIERKLVGSNNYKDVNEYKEKKDLEKEILSLENQLFEKKNELLEMSERLPGEIKIKAEREKKTEVVNKGFLKKEKVEKPTGNWIVGTKELKRVQGMINAGYSVKKDYDRLQRTDLVRENKELQGNLSIFMTDYMLHAKLIMNEKRIIVGSCNITDKAFTKLSELDVVVDNEDSFFARQVNNSIEELLNNSIQIKDSDEIKFNHIMAFLESIIMK